MSYKLFFILAVLIVPCALFSQSSTPTGNIEVVMVGFQSDTQNVDVALTQNKDEFKSDDIKPFMGGITAIKSGTARYTFKNVPYGEYAVKFFHDENGNGKLDKGTFGIPKEEYGLSNDVKSKNYDKAKFTLDQPVMTITIKVR